MHKKNGMTKRYWRILAIMKDVLLLNSGFPVIFQAKTINISNYLRNRLFTKCFKRTIILEETWTRNRQNLQYLQIFGYRANLFISSEKHIKSNIYKTQRDIFICYTDTSKHARVWASWTNQVLIANEPILDERQHRVQFLIEYPILLPEKLFKILLEEPKLLGQPRKDVLRKQTQLDTFNQPETRVKMNETVVNIGNLEVNGSEVVQSITTILRIRLDKSHNPPRMRLNRFHNLTVSKIDPDMSSSIKTICKLAQFLTETSSKMYELRFMIRQSMIQYTRKNGARLLTKSCGTWTYIKHDVAKNYHLEEKQLDASRSLKKVQV